MSVSRCLLFIRLNLRGMDRLELNHSWCTDRVDIYKSMGLRACFRLIGQIQQENFSKSLMYFHFTIILFLIFCLSLSFKHHLFFKSILITILWVTAANCKQWRQTPSSSSAELQKRPLPHKREGIRLKSCRRQRKWEPDWYRNNTFPDPCFVSVTACNVKTAKALHVCAHGKDLHVCLVNCLSPPGDTLTFSVYLHEVSRHRWMWRRLHWDSRDFSRCAGVINSGWILLIKN